MNPGVGFFLVFMGGGLGSLVRHIINQSMMPEAGPKFFPVHTLTINVVGSLVIGVLAGMVGGVGNLRDEPRLLLVVGVLGGFTTYSGFAYESLMLLRDGRVPAALGYVAATAVGCLLAVWAGWALGSLASK